MELHSRLTSAQADKNTLGTIAPPSSQLVFSCPDRRPFYFRPVDARIQRLVDNADQADIFAANNVQAVRYFSRGLTVFYVADDAFDCSLEDLEQEQKKTPESQLLVLLMCVCWLTRFRSPLKLLPLPHSALF